MGTQSEIQRCLVQSSCVVSPPGLAGDHRTIRCLLMQNEHILKVGWCASFPAVGPSHYPRAAGLTGLVVIV